MLDTESKLISEFLKDHQQFSRLLFEIERLLGEGHVKLARERAIELDQLAGPHIAYEEAELYPRLAKLGERNATEEALVVQHHDAVDALRILLANELLTETQFSQAIEGFRRALLHAEHCGSLISLMSLLDEAEQSESLKALERFREEGRLWTELE